MKTWQNIMIAHDAWQAGPANEKAGKKNKQKKMTLRQLFLSQSSGVANYGPEIIDHCVLLSGLSPSSPVDSLLAADAKVVGAVLKQLKAADQLVASMDVPGQPGYILFHEVHAADPAASAAQKKQQKQTATAKLPLAPPGSAAVTSGAPDSLSPSDSVGGGTSTQNKEYLEFVARRLQQHEGKPYLEFPTFDVAVDEYFCRLEEQKLQRQATAAEDAARKKIDKARGEQENHLKSLAEQQRRMEEGAMLVEAFAEDVDKALLVLNSAISSGMAWDDIAAMVQTETAAGECSL